MWDDLEFLSGLPDGNIEIDILNESAVHSVNGPLDLHITKELRAWLTKECEKEKIELPMIEGASLAVDVKTDKVATDKKKVVMFVFNCRSCIKTSDTLYESSLQDTHKWHIRTRV